VIARIWRGATSAEDADAYVDYLQETGLKEYRATPGNEAASLLRREVGDRTEFLALTFWASLDAIRGFAGKEIDTAVLYPEDARYLVERDTTVSHYEAREMAGRRTVPVEQGAISRVWHGMDEPGERRRVRGPPRSRGPAGHPLQDRGLQGRLPPAPRRRRGHRVRHDHALGLAGGDQGVCGRRPRGGRRPPEARALLDRFDERSSHYETIPARS
jgi:heme-degrading monooxygenase HmoA